jgi:lysophospholipase L1-like esterase
MPHARTYVVALALLTTAAACESAPGGADGRGAADVSGTDGALDAGDANDAAAIPDGSGDSDAAGDVSDAARDGDPGPDADAAPDAADTGEPDAAEPDADAVSDGVDADILEPRDAADADGAETGEADAVAADATDDDSDAVPAAAPVIVLAGDSWSAGLIFPLREALDARGHADVTVRWETTARAGSQARTWVRNEYPPALGGGVDTTQPRMLDGLAAALDGPTPADVFVLVIGGNDMNREAVDGLGERGSFLRDLTFDAIEDDIAALVDFALEGRPALDVVFVGYDYLHLEFLRAFGMRLDGYDITTYNEDLVELGRRQRAVADGREQVWYTNNYGLLQHVAGDTIHVPFSRPNPLTGYPEYGPGVAPRPGGPPDFSPFPGGFYTYPAPLDWMPDGIHASAAGYRVIADNVLDQQLDRLLDEARASR